jgi:hypothetical protein
MTVPRVWGLLAALALGAGGCASCQPDAERGAPRRAAPAAPTVATAPTAPAAPAAAPQPAEVDCFVFVDAEPDLGDAPLESHFSTEVDCGESAVTFAWDFGDGTKGGNEPNPTHVYRQAGDYVATVTVTTASGATGSDEIDIFVDEPEGK